MPRQRHLACHLVENRSRFLFFYVLLYLRILFILAALAYSTHDTFMKSRSSTTDTLNGMKKAARLVSGEYLEGEEDWHK